MRKFILIIAALAMLSLSGAVFAQSTTPQTFCGDLSSADCQILTQSEAAMKTLDSSSFNFNVSVQMSNLPDMPAMGPITLDGSGGVSGLSALHTDPATMMADYGAFFQNLLTKLNGNFKLTVTVPPELMQQADPGAPNSLTLDVRMVDGVGYLNMDELQPLINDATIKGWYGLDFAGLMKGLLEQNPNLFDMANMGAMAGGANSMSYMQQFQDPAFLNQFLTITRTDDGSGNTATFHMTLDFAALMSSPQLHDLMLQQMQQQMQAQGSKLTDQEMQQALAMSQQMFTGMTFTIDEVISTTDYYIQSVTGEMNFDLSGIMNSVSAMSATPMPTTTGAPTINVTFSVNYADFNNAPMTTAPENPTLIPYQMLLGMANMNAQPAATATVEATTEAPMESTVVPPVEMTVEPTVEVTTEVTLEPTAEVTVEMTAPVSP
jgi:hypothetical protein